MDRTCAISVRNAAIGYSGKKILSGLDFDIRYGEITAVLGGSGCGKSTLLKTIIGLIPIIEGDIFIQGKSLVRASQNEKLRLLRSFGVAFQSGALFRSYTVEENVALPLEEFTDLSKDEIHDRVMEKLALVGLAGHEDKMPGDLSGGMVKRAAVARAMALDPKILFLDEPSAGLDPVTSTNLDALIKKIRDQFNTAVVIVTHELDSLFSIADRALFLGNGTVMADGDPRVLRDSSPDETVRNFLNRKSCR